MKNLITILFVILYTQSVEAQLFDRIVKRTQDKIENKIEDKIVERISEEIARAAMRPVDKALDNMLKERYEQDSIEGRTTGNYDDFLGTFLRPVDLPESYSFDLTMLVETKDYNGQKNEMEMLYRKDGTALGVIQFEDGNKSMMVFDLENDIMAMYQENGEKGKEVTAMPSMLSLAGTMANVNDEELGFKGSIERTGKSKKIVGYDCSEYKFEDEETKSKAYMAENFPITWKEAYGPFMKQIMPTRKDDLPEGMVMKSESKTKKKNKKTTYEVKKVIEETLTIENSEYKKISYTEN